MTAIISLLIPALNAVESGGNPAAIGDNGRAVGCLQIRAECLSDVNRIAGTQYTPTDRLSPEKSTEMCRLYLTHYGNAYRRRTGEEPNAEILARIWNGGPSGYAKTATARYWEKTRAHLKKAETKREETVSKSGTAESISRAPPPSDTPTETRTAAGCYPRRTHARAPVRNM